MVDLGIIFILGVTNFALHKAVLASGHPMLAQMARRGLNGRITLLFEFLVLLAALMLTANGWVGLLWAYGAYTILSAATAWLVLKDRL